MRALYGIGLRFGVCCVVVIFTGLVIIHALRAIFVARV
jgi:hypothetical protein